jgi:hypothetical protein
MGQLRLDNDNRNVALGVSDLKNRRRGGFKRACGEAQTCGLTMSMVQRRT